MIHTRGLAWQMSLLGDGETGFDPTFGRLRRRELGNGAWVDEIRWWVRGANELFASMLDLTPWQLRYIWIQERQVTEPRRTHSWRLDKDEAPLPILREMAEALSRHYRVDFTQIVASLFRHGSDSVAWHGDPAARALEVSTVAVVSLGAPRPFKLRPSGGGRSVGLVPDHGDLLVMGGSCQRTWHHSVPKTKWAGPRVTVQFRHAHDG